MRRRARSTHAPYRFCQLGTSCVLRCQPFAEPLDNSGQEILLTGRGQKLHSDIVWKRSLSHMTLTAQPRSLPGTCSSRSTLSPWQRRGESNSLFGWN